MRFSGLLLQSPGSMSFTITVPASVPSLFHSSYPYVRIISREIQGAVDIGETLRGTVTGTWINIFHHHRARGSSVTPPQFVPVRPVIQP